MEANRLRACLQLLAKCGVVERSVACANAAAGNRRARNAMRANRLIGAGPRQRRQVPEDRRHVAIGEEHRGEDDERERERRPVPARARPDRHPEREEGGDEERPAEQVVQERRAREEPAVLLVDEERDAGNDEGERHREVPPARLEPPVHEPQLGAAGEEQHFGPRAVRVHVDRRVGVEGHHGPHQDAHHEDEARPQVGPPGAHPPDLLPDYRLADEAEPEQQQARREQPVHHFSGRLHPSPPDLRSEVARRRARR